MSNPSEPRGNGHAFHEGASLGQIIVLIGVLREEVRDLPDRIAAKVGEKKDPGGLSIQLRDLPGIILGLGAILAAATGKLSLAVELLEKVTAGP